jgi:adenylate cyclase
MAIEIERKFLVVGGGWRKRVDKTLVIRQGYLQTRAGTTVRIRIAADSLVDRPHATLTVKGPTTGIVRAEFEHEIPLEDAQEMLDLLCGTRIVEKWRHLVPSSMDGCPWEIDEFVGRHAGLVLAEVELDKSSRRIRLPKWIGREVSRESRYSNRSLAIHGMGLVSSK